MDDTGRSVLAAALPDRAVAAVEPASGSDHPGNRTLRVTLPGGDRAYLKLRTDGDRERNAREAAVTRYAGRHCEVRAPAVVAADSAFDPPYLATARLDGTPVADRWQSAGAGDAGAERGAGDAESAGELEALAGTVGRAVAGVAAARFDEPGWVVGGDGDGLDHETGPWSAVLADAVERRVREVPYPNRFAGVPDRVGALLRDRAGVLDDAAAALVHCDLRAENVLLDGTPGVVDWEWTLVGDPGLGLCWTAGRVVERADVPEGRRDRLRAALYGGYRDVAGGLPPGFERRRPLHRVVAFLEKPATFDRWAPAAPEPTDELAAWVREELDRRMAAAESTR